MFSFESSVRLLIAFDLSLKSVERLTLVQRTIEASAPRDGRFRWEDPCNIRANLLILNDVDSLMIPHIFSALAKIVDPLFPFELTIERIYAGPDRKRPRFFYAGIDQTASEVLGLLHLMLGREFANFGLTIPKKTYIPSIFLGRGLSNFDSKRALKRVRNLRVDSSVIRDISIFQAVNAPLSERTGDYMEPTFKVLNRFALGS